MRTFLPAVRHRLVAIIAGLVIVVALAACAPTTPADGPGSVVGDAMAKVAAKDIDGLRTLACAGQEDLIRTQLGIAGALGDAALLPGLDVQGLLDAVSVDVGKVRLGDAAIDGDVAEVPVTGTIKITFDKVAMRPVLQKLLAQQGTTMNEDQVTALLDALEVYGQDLPLDQTVRLVRETGTWKICQETVALPSSR